MTATREKRRAGKWTPAIIAGILLFLGFLCRYSAKWYLDVYGRIGFDSILYTLTASLSGVQTDLLINYLKNALLPTFLAAALVWVLLFVRSGKKLVMTLFGKRRLTVYPFRRGAACLMGALLSLTLILYTANWVGLVDYLKASVDYSTLFEEAYRDPAEVEITFPAKKRNLIYIYLESMETGYQSVELGGQRPANLIPELTRLAQEQVNFSHNGSVGGFLQTSGTGWTIGAMTAQSAGIPLKVPPGFDGNAYGSDGVFLPGVTALGDILRENGYYQALMVGSEAVFGGREAYYRQHGVDRIYEYATAVEEGIIPEGYYVWWGMEDAKLYAYAKQELPQLARQEQPFALTLLTVDTHHVAGYPCEYCGEEFAEQYENVIACASRQAAAFVEWVQQQDFYENTTIVICGDHLSMDNDYFVRNGFDQSARRVYNCIVNASQPAENTKNRHFSAMDLFPTTLTAMGCRITGDRLGLGTDLFSDTPTLMEEMGTDAFLKELEKASRYYYDNFFFSH